MSQARLAAEALSSARDPWYYVKGDLNTIAHGLVFDTRVFDGIAIFGDRNEIRDNEISKVRNPPSSSRATATRSRGIASTRPLSTS
jgi:hypothetical protein